MFNGYALEFQDYYLLLVYADDNTAVTFDAENMGDAAEKFLTCCLNFETVEELALNCNKETTTLKELPIEEAIKCIPLERID